MALTKRKRKNPQPLPSPPSPSPSPSCPPSPSSFISSISTVAVAQICQSVGYTTAEPAALRSLSSITSLYIQTLATSAASIANSKNRTQSNVLDVIQAAEELSVAQGFPGASNPTRSLLKSSVLKDLRWFVGSVDEIPFAKPILREIRASEPGAASYAQVGKEPPFGHVPRWLPCFPEGWERWRYEEGGGPSFPEGWRWGEGGGGGRIKVVELQEEEEEEEEECSSATELILKVESSWASEMLEGSRERVRFKMGGRSKKKKKNEKLLVEIN